MGVWPAETAFTTVFFTCHKIRQFAGLFFASSSHLSGLHAAASALARWMNQEVVQYPNIKLGDRAIASLCV